MESKLVVELAHCTLKKTLVLDSTVRRKQYRHDGNTFAITQPIDGQPATTANGGTIGFKCASTAQVDAFHAAALAHGGQPIEDPPGLRQGAAGSYYIAYVRDPDGHKICALHRPA